MIMHWELMTHFRTASALTTTSVLVGIARRFASSPILCCSPHPPSQHGSMSERKGPPKKKRTATETRKKPRELSHSSQEPSRPVRAPKINRSKLTEGMSMDGDAMGSYIQGGVSAVVSGSFKEGGGQILRNASALAAITNQQIYVDDIRASTATSHHTPKPGLRPQHLTGLQIMADISGGILLNGEVGSTIINFKPGKLRVGKFYGDTVTAGSVTLLIQSVLPCLLYASPTEEGNDVSVVELRGGTDVGMAPPIDYLRYVLVPILRSKFGIEVEVEVVKRGFNPVGGGIVLLRVQCLPREKPLPAIDLSDPGTISLMTIHAFAAGRYLVAKGEQKIVNDAVNNLKALFGMRIEDMLEIHAVRETDQTAMDSGTGCCIVAESTTGQIFGGAGMAGSKSGKKKKKEGTPLGAQQKGSAGSDAAYEIYDFIEKHTGVDDWMQDQLILFMALAAGKSRIRVWGPTSHTETAIHVAQRLTNATFRITMGEQRANAPPTWIIECDGIGMTRK